MGPDLMQVAQRYADRWLPGHVNLARLASLPVRVDEDFCREVADHFDRQPVFSWAVSYTHLTLPTIYSV